MYEILKMNEIISSFKIKASCVDYVRINNYFYYDFVLNDACKVKDILKFSDEIGLRLKTPTKPTIIPIHFSGVVRMEFILPRESVLSLFDYFTNDNVPSGDLICLLGESVVGKPVWFDLAKSPHLLAAGTTGSGKSSLLHNIIANIFNYNDANIIIFDPKNSEFKDYANINSVQVFNTLEECQEILKSLIATMNFRFSIGNMTNMPRIVLLIDEFADLIMQDSTNEFYKNLCFLAQKCRAAKINIIIATQRPSVNIVNGAIKANFPSRISCKVASHVDSKVILDMVGAENLNGSGDAILKDNNSNITRFQIAYTDANEVYNTLGILN